MNSDLTSYVVIRTIPQQIAGKCDIYPDSGIAGITLFTITCSDFQNMFNDNNLMYYLYEQYEVNQLFGNNKRIYLSYSRYFNKFYHQ